MRGRVIIRFVGADETPCGRPQVVITVVVLRVWDGTGTVPYYASSNIALNVALGRMAAVIFSRFGR